MLCEHIFTYIIYALHALKILLIHKKVCVRCTQISPFFVYAVHKFFRYTNNILQLCELYVIYLWKTLNRGHSIDGNNFRFSLHKYTVLECSRFRFFYIFITSFIQSCKKLFVHRKYMYTAYTKNGLFCTRCVHIFLRI